MVVIDYAGFPHIIEKIIRRLSPRDCRAIRATCRELRDFVDSIRRDHIVPHEHKVYYDTMMFITYRSGHLVPGIWFAYLHHPYLAIYPCHEEKWETDKDVCNDIRVVDILPHNLNYSELERWTWIGYTFRPNILRVEWQDPRTYSALVQAPTVAYLLDVDANIAPPPYAPDDPADTDDYPHSWRPRDPKESRKHVNLIELGLWDVEVKDFVLTIALYGDCRPYTPRIYQDAQELESITVIFVHKGQSERPATTDRPPADGFGMLALLIGAAASYYRTASWTFVGLVEHAAQLGVVDSPMDALEMHAHLMECITATQSRMGITELKEKARFHIPEIWIEDSQVPTVRLLTHDECRERVGQYDYDLYTFRDWVEPNDKNYRWWKQCQARDWIEQD